MSPLSLEKIINISANTYSEVIVVGDFNIDLIAVMGPGGYRQYSGMRE